MKVKVGSETYDGQVEPVMLILNEQDKENIRNMPEGTTKYCCYPEAYLSGILDWMEE